MKRMENKSGRMLDRRFAKRLFSLLIALNLIFNSFCFASDTSDLVDKAMRAHAESSEAV